MKRFGILIFTILFVGISAFSQSKKGKEEMAFDKTANGITAHDFGSIVYGANGIVDFTFTNNGTKDLVINDVKSSCNCAVPNWPKEPIKPGQKSTIKIEYNTRIAGVFNKTIVVYSNADNSPSRLEIRGKVNAQASDYKTGQGVNKGIDVNKDIAQEDEYAKGMNGEGTAQNSAQKAAQAEAFKKLTEQNSATPVTPKTQGTKAATQSTTQTATKKK